MNKIEFIQNYIIGCGIPTRGAIEQAEKSWDILTEAGYGDNKVDGDVDFTGSTGTVTLDNLERGSCIKIKGDFVLKVGDGFTIEDSVDGDNLHQGKSVDFWMKQMQQVVAFWEVPQDTRTAVLSVFGAALASAEKRDLELDKTTDGAIIYYGGVKTSGGK